MKHNFYMKYSLSLANKGLRDAMPNPSVGAVIVYEDKIIGEGYTSSYGGNHAEVNAINAVIDKSLLRKSTLYVTLEPCSHFGKTPPCSNLIIESGFATVVVGTRDPNKLVNGAGIEMLKNAGIKVVEGILENECYEINKRFFTFHKKGRPYIILKWAQTQDGFIDRIRKNNEKGINWITHREIKLLTHLWRTEEMAISVGTNTIKNDNPSLTAREIKGCNPVRFLIDKNLQLNLNLNVFSNNAQVIVFNEHKDLISNNITYKKVDFNFLIDEVLTKLFQMNVLSIIIEGGSYFINSFLEKNIWDEARVITGNVKFLEGILAPKINEKPYKEFDYQGDLVSFYKIYENNINEL